MSLNPSNSKSGSINSNESRSQMIYVSDTGNDRVVCYRIYDDVDGVACLKLCSSEANFTGSIKDNFTGSIKANFKGSIKANFTRSSTSAIAIPSVTLDPKNKIVYQCELYINYWSLMMPYDIIIDDSNANEESVIYVMDMNAHCIMEFVKNNLTKDNLVLQVEPLYYIL